MVIRDAATPELWVLSQSAPPRLLLDAVETFVVEDDRTVLAVRDEGSVRVDLAGADRGRPAGIDRRAARAGAADRNSVRSGSRSRPMVGPSPRAGSAGRSRSAGRDPRAFDDVGAPLVVADDGRLVATARAGQARRTSSRAGS